jgi:hypothetical protein
MSNLVAKAREGAFQNEMAGDAGAAPTEIEVALWPKLRLHCIESLRPFLKDHARSKRSRFITLLQAATKSCTKSFCESLLA